MSTIAALSPKTFSFTPSNSVLPSKITNIWNAFKESLGAPVQKALFPLSHKIPLAGAKILQKETEFFYNFWDKTQPINPQIPHHQEIRDQFVWKKEQTSIEVDGKILDVEYSVFEPSEASDSEFQLPSQNLVYLSGIFAKNDSNMTCIYPFLVSYLEEKKKNPSLAPVRFILLSQYDTLSKDGEIFRAKTMDQAGLVLIKSLESIQEQKGPINQLTAHSLGGIVLAAGLKYGVNTNILPKNIYFDRNPSSLEKVSQTMGWQGWVLLQLAKISGWNVDIGLEIHKHLENRPGQTVFISNVEQDHRFKGVTSLHNSPHLQNAIENKGFHILSFDFARQLHMEEGHHSLHNGLLDYFHLKNKTGDLKNQENMADLMVCSIAKDTPSLLSQSYTFA